MIYITYISIASKSEPWATKFNRLCPMISLRILHVFNTGVILCVLKGKGRRDRERAVEREEERERGRNTRSITN